MARSACTIFYTGIYLENKDIDAQIQARTHSCTRVHAPHTHTHARTHARTHTHTHTHTYAHTHAHTHRHTHFLLAKFNNAEHQFFCLMRLVLSDHEYIDTSASFRLVTTLCFIIVHIYMGGSSHINLYDDARPSSRDSLAAG